MNHKVSVIIPTYQRADFLTRAIDSVLNQSYKSIEVIVVDDNPENSPYQNATEDIITRLYKDDDRVIYIQNNQNIGGANSRNKGARIATGDYLCFLDDDDIYLPEKIEKQLKYMVENGLDVSFTDIKMLDEKGRVVDLRDHSRYIKSLDNSELLKYHLMHHLTPTDTYMFSRTAFFKTEGFKQRPVSQEFMLMLDCIQKGLKIGYLKGVYAVQYIHSRGRVSSAAGRAAGDKALYELKKGYFYLLSPSERRYINFRYHAVFSVYYLRNKDFKNALCHLVKSFFISPYLFIKEGASLLLRLRKA